MTLPGADSGSQPTVAGDASLPIREAGHGPTSPCDLSGREVSAGRRGLRQHRPHRRARRAVREAHGRERREPGRGEDGLRVVDEARLRVVAVPAVHELASDDVGVDRLPSRNLRYRYRAGDVVAVRDRPHDRRDLPIAT